MRFYVFRIVDGNQPRAGEPVLIASFPSIDEAQRVAQSAQQNDPTNRNEYIVTIDPEGLLSAARKPN